MNKCSARKMRKNIQKCIKCPKVKKDQKNGEKEIISHKKKEIK